MTLLRNLARRNAAAGRPAAPPAPEAPAGAPAAPEPTPTPAAPVARAPRTRGIQTPGLLKPVLERVDSVPQHMREQGSDRIHVKGLMRDCPRSLQLAQRSVVPLFQESPTGGHQVMWKIGRAVEEHIRNQYIRGVDGRNVRGKWTCKCGALEIRADNRPDEDVICEACRSTAHTYKELGIYNADYGIIGSPDMILIVDGLDVVVEIKSMQQEEFEQLNGQPHGNHVEQAALYRWLSMQAGRAVAPYVVIVYCTKRFVWGSPYEEMHVDVSEGTYWDTGVQLNLEKARMIQRRELCPRLPECVAPARPRAKKCPTCVDCFSRST